MFVPPVPGVTVMAALAFGAARATAQARKSKIFFMFYLLKNENGAIVREIFIDFTMTKPDLKIQESAISASVPCKFKSG